jgi:hypothetical protein
MKTFSERAKELQEGITAAGTVILADELGPTVRETVFSAPIEPSLYGVQAGQHGGGHGAYFWGVRLPSGYDTTLVNDLVKTYGPPSSEIGGSIWEWRSNTSSGQSLEGVAQKIRWWMLTHGKPLPSQDSSLEALRSEAEAFETEMKDLGITAVSPGFPEKLKTMSTEELRRNRHLLSQRIDSGDIIDAIDKELESREGMGVSAAAEGMLSVGDTVLHRGSYGEGAEAPAVIAGITLADEKGGSEGVAVDRMNWNLVPEWAVVDLADAGGWAYGRQIKPMPVDYKVAAKKPSRGDLEQAAMAVFSPDEQALYRQMSLVSGLQKFGADADPAMVQRMKDDGLVTIEVYEGIPLDPELTAAGRELFQRLWAKVLGHLGIAAGMTKPMAWVKKGLRRGIAQEKDPGCWPAERLFDQPDLYHKNLNTIQDTPPQSGVSTIG